MNEIDDLGIDLNLLGVFGLLMRERSVTAAARHLSVGQPAVSHALARLRRQLDDPLFVRNGRTMEPTPRALDLERTIRPALLEIEAAIRSARPFDPQAEDRTLRVAMSDDLLVTYLPAIVAALRERLPKTRLIAREANYLRAGNLLESRGASIVAGYLDDLPAVAKIRTVRRVRYRVLMAPEYAEPIDLARYCARPHVLVTFAADLVGYVDETLRSLGAARNIDLSVPAFAVLPSLIRGTPYIATVPDYVAGAMAEHFGLIEGALPFDSPEFDISIAWHAAVDQDPAEAILRQVIIATLQG